MNSKSNKILFALNYQEYFRNYIDSQALSLIRKNCIFLISSNITDQQFKQLGKNKAVRYDYPQEKSKLHWHLFNINTKKFMAKSKTFQFRFARLSKRKQQFYSILTLPFIYDLVKFFILKYVDDKKLSKLIDKLKPDVILIPSTGYEGLTFELIKVARNKQIPTLMLIDNWDNLCSKTILTRKPDYMAVWGRQTKEHAQRIHGMGADRVFILGTPRFIQYFRAHEKKPPSVYPFKYALFAGNALAFDELTTLKKLDELIQRSGRKLTIIYRPHPWRHPRKCADTFFEYDFKHVKLDNDAKKYYKRELGDSYAPELSYYPKILANMQFMITPLSTMLIEGLLFDKRVYVLTYDDGIHFTNPKNAFKYYEHFGGIDNLDNVTIIGDFSKLKKIADYTLAKKGAKKYKSAPLDYYITQDTIGYQANLKSATDQILKSWRQNSE